MAPTKKPRPRDASRTRALILAKATELFAAGGYDGTSISDVVAATGVNKRMIYHYFGDKRGLYRTVSLEQWMGLKEWLDQAVQERILGSGAGPADTGALALEALGIFYDFMAEHREFVRLMMWDGLEGGEIARDLWGDVRGPLFVQASFLVRQAQREHRLDPRLDPAHLIISFLGVAGFHFAYASSLGDLIGKEPLAPDAIAERRDQVLRLLEGLMRRPEEDEAPGPDPGPARRTPWIP